MRAHWHSYSRMTLLGPSKQNNYSSFTVLSMEKYIFQDLNHCLILEDKVHFLWVHAQKCCLFSIFTMLYGTHLTSSIHDTQLDRMPTTTTLQQRNIKACTCKQKKKKSYGISDIWTTFLLVPGHCPGMGTLSGCGLTHPLLQNTRGFLPEVVDFDDIFLKIKNKCNTASFSNSISLAIHRIALKLGRHWDQCWSPKTVSNRLFWF